MVSERAVGEGRDRNWNRNRGGGGGGGYAARSKPEIESGCHGGELTVNPPL